MKRDWNINDNDDTLDTMVDVTTDPIQPSISSSSIGNRINMKCEEKGKNKMK